MGQLVKTVFINNGAEDENINISDLKSGNYMLKIRNESLKFSCIK